MRKYDFPVLSWLVLSAGRETEVRDVTQVKAVSFGWRGQESGTWVQAGMKWRSHGGI